MYEHLDLSQRIHNAAASQEVETLHAAHEYLHNCAFSKEEWNSIWSKNEDVSWGHFFGRMRGWDEVWYGSVGNYDRMCYLDYCNLMPVYPEVIGMDPRPFTWTGMHTLANGIVEVADDGKSARTVYITPGMGAKCLSATKHKEGAYLWERYGADFILEDGKWLYLHQQVCPDFEGDIDIDNWAQVAYKQEKAGGINVPNNAPPFLEDPGPLHFRYSPIQTVQDTVPWPEPYKTFDEEHTYAPPRRNKKPSSE